jgi:hypothetical protein
MSETAPEYPPAPTEHDLMLRLLYDEQARLRTEVERLRQNSDGKDKKEQGKEGDGGKKEEHC